MKIFTNQIDLTAFLEGFRAQAYQDIAGVWTIGCGQAHTLPDGTPITPDMTCTEEQARDWLDLELRTRYNYFFNNLPLSTCFSRLNAITDYSYNCGVNAFPKLLAKLKANDIPGAALEFLDGFYVNSKPILGLLLRRISEYNTFLTGQYIAFEKNDPISQDLMDKLIFMNAHNPDAVNMIKEVFHC